jgi:hypothetical protein
MNRLLLLLLLGPLLLAGRAEGQTSAPQTTPTGAAAGTLPLTLSYVIDGVAYVVTCNFSGVIATNCTFVTDHGLNVTKIYTTGSTDLPVYYQAMVGATLGLVVVLLVIMIIGFCLWKQKADRENAAYQPVPQGYAGPQGVYPSPEAFYSQASQLNAQHKVIHVGLVRPGLPVEAVMRAP